MVSTTKAVLWCTAGCLRWQSVVMVSLDDFNALEETAYLLRAPKNARRLLDAIAELQEGLGTERELAE